jgi:uncharacterized protein YjbI with pentapeptide repeats
MDPQVQSALIAAGVSIISIGGTVVVAWRGFHATKQVTKDAVEGAHKDTAATIDAQKEQLRKTLAEQHVRTLNERFATAADKLGGDKPPAVRLAGVYAMAVLADDWPQNRQTCVDVLCGYLRMPYEPGPVEQAPAPEQLAFRASREVRHTVIRIITAHLKDGAAVSWQGLNFDFSGVVFDGGSFSDANFSGGTADFSSAVFAGGRVDFGGARFSGGTVRFDVAKFSGGEVGFGAAKFSGGTVSFIRAEFSGAEVSFNYAKFSRSNVDFTGAEFSDCKVSFWSTQFSDHEVDFFGAKFTGAEVSFGYAKISGGIRFNRAVFARGNVDFGGAEFSGGYVGFSGAEFSGSTVDFSRAKFTGSWVDFVGDASPAKFTAGTVDFSDAGNWSHKPTFPWTATSLWGTTSPPSVKLPEKKDQSQA